MHMQSQAADVPRHSTRGKQYDGAKKSRHHTLHLVKPGRKHVSCSYIPADLWYTEALVLHFTCKCRDKVKTTVERYGLYLCLHLITCCQSLFKLKSSMCALTEGCKFVGVTCLLDGDGAVHARALVGLAVVGVLSWGGKLG